MHEVLTVVDTDIHPVTRTAEELADYTPEPWRSRNYGRRHRVPATAPVNIFPPPHADVGGVQRETVPPDGSPAASDPVFSQQQLLERSAIDYGILIPLIARPKVNPEEEASNCTAVNRWLADTWLSSYDTHDIFKGTLRVACQDPDLMVREVKEWAGHPGFIQVMLDPGNPTPFGDPRYDRFYRECERQGLAVGFHVIKGYRFLTPTGTPSYWTEYMTALALTYVAQLVSMVMGGVFERFPGLRVAFIEGGFGWLLPVMYRMDKHFKELGPGPYGLKRNPSEYIRDQVRFDTQPFEEATDSKALNRMFEYLDCDQLLMFASDYPHCDGDVPAWVYKRLPAHLRDGILRDNALEFYGLPRKSAGHVLATAAAG